ncbi:hypothetical protein AUJ68_04095 [Candidatus Woesearchaeota archaeon CG1_02_57_44]|nr:MAG: hypothetical protein AUJ68_04095 [Candidatus Woesearchaeota archaeon CG1_02_57_44]
MAQRLRRKGEERLSGPITTAFRRAIIDLRSCYRDGRGINAGAHQFADLWARDSCFASWGALAIGDTAIVQQNLLTFADAMRDDQVPLRIGARSMAITLTCAALRLPGRGPQGYAYSEDKLRHIPTDGNSLFIITAAALLDRKDHLTKDQRARIHAAMLRADRWNQRQCDRAGLIRETSYASWADAVRKRGAVLYTNVLYWKALTDLASLSSRLRDRQQADSYRRCAQKVQAGINARLWNGSYFSDWADASRRDIFSADGNLLAVWWGLATRRQATALLRYAEQQDIWTIPAKTTDRPYRQQETSLLLRALGMGDYHSHAVWPWLGALAALANQRAGNRRAALAILHTMAGTINTHGTQEILDQDGIPLRRLLYRSEHPFAWTAGLFILACRETSMT